MLDYDNSVMCRLIEERIHKDVDRTPRQIYYIVTTTTKHLNRLL